MPLQKRTDALDWNDLRYVLALARHGSLSATARLLKVNHATVARRIAALEGSLGMTLFERRARGYVPTPAAAPVLQAAEQIEAPLLRLARLGDAKTGEQIAGTVRITCTEGVASHTVAPQLAGLRQRWPGLQIELAVEHRSLSLARREADIAIRWARPKTGELYASKLGAVPYRLYRNPAALDRNAVAAFDESLAEIPESLWLKTSGLTQAIRSNSMIPLVAAARAGACAVLLPEYIGRQYAELMPDPGKPPVTRELWLVLHRDLRNTPRIRVVTDYLSDSIRRMLRTA
ncbi:LysR family transcriptional regulator [Ferrovibrio terrae]|uniref:LysR family transcriptional regulator n=1 Tax=Ferrovibrio terrae TaxID=2594003 RepID=A0A516H592_9PROT|nr:LysR family transcriptional regulator [Ferrovibrio terrae]QDO98916.1 LysR family transcriptional regulator [Ferrovibrio terrae]